MLEPGTRTGLVSLGALFLAALVTYLVGTTVTERAPRHRAEEYGGGV